nr:unnamed protein product [Spirometra erinaceieuropaei]
MPTLSAKIPRIDRPGLASPDPMQQRPDNSTCRLLKSLHRHSVHQPPRRPPPPPPPVIALLMSHSRRRRRPPSPQSP